MLSTPGVRTASELNGEPRAPWLEEFAEFAANLKYSDLPPQVVARARQVVLDTIGAIAAGQQEPEMRALAGAVLERGGQGATPVVGSSLRLAPADAAFLAGVAGTMLEIDEGNQYARGHPAIHVLPAALVASARAGASGRDLIVALVLGYEIGARIGLASKLVVTMHPHGTWGVVGAALACARIAEVDAATMARTISIASTLGLATSRRTMLEGATVRNAYAGLANRLGMTAFDLALAGFTGERDGVATIFGEVAATDFEAAAMVEDLGVRYEIARNYFKRHAACRYTHAALDALGDIRRQAGGRIDPKDVLGIEVETYVWAAQLDDPEPASMLAAKFSLPFAIATTLVNGAATLDAFRDEARGDRVTRALANRVTVTEAPEFTAMLPTLRPARVTLRLADGRAFTATALTNRGDTEDPYSPAEVEAKFLEVATPVYGEARARRILLAVAALGETTEPHALLTLCMTGDADA